MPANDQGMEIAASVAKRMNDQLRGNQERTAKMATEQRRKQEEVDDTISEICAQAAANLNRGNVAA